MAQFESEKKRSEMPKSKERPAWVDRAVKTDDLATLRYAAQKSHEARARNKDNKDEEEQFYGERRVARSDADAIRAAEVEREHIVPIDPEQEAA
jgi:hypothetical protein